MKTAFGFTLLELLIVLMLIALLSAMVLPRLDKIWASSQQNSKLQSLNLQLSLLGLAVKNSGTDFILHQLPLPEEQNSTTIQQTINTDSATNTDSAINKSIQIPKDWQIQAPEGIQYYATGVCLGGEIIAIHNNERFYATLNAPHCKVHLK